MLIACYMLPSDCAFWAEQQRLQWFSGDTYVDVCGLDGYCILKNIAFGRHCAACHRPCVCQATREDRCF